MTQAYSQQAVAYVYYDSLLLAHPNYMSLFESFQAKAIEYQEESKKIKQEISEKWQKLSDKYKINVGETITELQNRMSPEDTMKFNLLVKEEQFVQEKIKSFENSINFIYQRDINPILETIDKTINEYAAKNKIDMVFIAEKMQESTVYLNPNKNFTQKIIGFMGKK